MLHPRAERWTVIIANAQGKIEFNEGKGGRLAPGLDEVGAIFLTCQKDSQIDRLVLALGGNDARDAAVDIAGQVARNVEKILDRIRREAPLLEVTIYGPYMVNSAYPQRKQIADLREKIFRPSTLLCDFWLRARNAH